MLMIEWYNISMCFTKRWKLIRKYLVMRRQGSMATLVFWRNFTAKTLLNSWSALREDMRETSGRDSQNVSSNYICMGTVIPSIIIGPLYIYFQNSNQKPPSLLPPHNVIPKTLLIFLFQHYVYIMIEIDVWRICFFSSSFWTSREFVS